MMYVQNIISKGMLNMEMKMDLNSLVKVKLTDYGVTVLKARYEKYKLWCYKNGVKFDEFDLELDEDGYYTKTMWRLMEVFGEHLHPKEKTVFESELIVLDATPVSE